MCAVCVRSVPVTESLPLRYRYLSPSPYLSSTDACHRVPPSPVQMPVTESVPLQYRCLSPSPSLSGTDAVTESVPLQYRCLSPSPYLSSTDTGHRVCTSPVRMPVTESVPLQYRWRHCRAPLFCQKLTPLPGRGPDSETHRILTLDIAYCEVVGARPNRLFATCTSFDGLILPHYADWWMSCL